MEPHPRPEELQGSSISLSGNPHPQNYRSIPFLCLSGNRTSRLRDVKGRSLGSRIPETRWPVNADFLLFFVGTFSYRDFGTRDIKQLDLPTPDTRYAETPMHTCELTFQRSRHFYRDFRLRGIANPNVNVSGLYFPRTPIRCATCPPLTPVWPTLSFSRRDIAFRIPSCKSILSLKTPMLRTRLPLNLLTRVPNDGRFWARRDIADRDIAIPVAIIWSFDSRNPDPRYACVNPTTLVVLINGSAPPEL
jgi:hypothetical protein